MASRHRHVLSLRNVAPLGAACLLMLASSVLVGVAPVAAQSAEKPVHPPPIEGAKLAPRTKTIARPRITLGSTKPQRRRRAAADGGIASRLRRLAAAQARFRADAVVDEDADGDGEFGGFVELSGRGAGRMGTRLAEPYVDRALGALDTRGSATARGYLFRIFLPGRHGFGIGERTRGFGAGMCDPSQAETGWMCYAWPVEYGRSGTRTFFISEKGIVLATDCARYSGAGRGPRAGAAFDSIGARDGIIEGDAVRRSQDGNVWAPLTGK